MTNTITPILLSGGSGTRLWPLSRKSYPKQFSSLLGETTLLQAAAQRLTTSDRLQFNAPVILTHSDFRFIVTEQLSTIGVDPGAILIEPSGKNTAPAILAAAYFISKDDPDQIMLVAPSDHVMPDTPAFHNAVAQGLGAMDDGKIVTFGITPSRPETGYGYLELAGAPSPDGGTVSVSKFVEKPCLIEAERMASTGTYLWNAGIFMFRARDIIAAFERFAPELTSPTYAAVDNAKVDLGFLRLAPEEWDGIQGESIDYAVMEHAPNIVAVPFDGNWSDLGGWDAIWREAGPDDAGVVTTDGATAIECENTLLRSEGANQELVGIGLQNIMAIAMNDAVLVADMSRAQDVKQAVTVLQKKDVSQATSFPKEHRPWGWFESLVMGNRFQVKRINVNPGAALSLQSHFHRAEHWIVVAGTAQVTLDGAVSLLSENQSVYIPIGSKHRLENPGKVPVILIEVQTGSYVGEDDIVRFDDRYSRK